MPPIPPRAARLYADHADRLASQVSHLLMQHPRLDEFLNGNAFRLLEVNHRNHGAFVAEVLRTRNFELLAKSLPWAYHAYHHQGVPYDYFPVQLDAWKRAIREQLPSAEAASLMPLYDWMLAVHADVIAAAKRYRSERPTVPVGLVEVHGKVVEALIAGDHLAVLHHCQNLLNEGMTFPRLLQWIFYPAMVEIGVRWEKGAVSVEMEHQATAMAYLVLSALYYEQPFPAKARGRAIVASVTNEFHELGAWMVASCLELDGWDVTFLASDCALETLVDTMRAESPRFIALSVSLLSNLEAARETVAALRADLGPASDTPILVGGRALLTAPSLLDAIGADLFLTDCEAAVIWARSLEIAA
ncbi:cobalamin B12-binding domain-containing protein [Thiocystis violascens]|nr:cobalamin-dependent protein [Thiocystis violascens]